MTFLNQEKSVEISKVSRLSKIQLLFKQYVQKITALATWHPFHLYSNECSYSGNLVVSGLNTFCLKTRLPQCFPPDMEPLKIRFLQH